MSDITSSITSSVDNPIVIEDSPDSGCVDNPIGIDDDDHSKPTDVPNTSKYIVILFI